MDALPSMISLAGAMKKVMASPIQKELQSLPDYPRETAGSILARKARSKANSLSDKEREELFRQGMAIIYGIQGGKAVRSRR
jgi:hypothetical protein